MFEIGVICNILALFFHNKSSLLTRVESHIHFPNALILSCFFSTSNPKGLSYPAKAPTLNIQNNNFSAVNVSSIGPLVTVTFEVQVLVLIWEILSFIYSIFETVHLYVVSVMTHRVFWRTLKWFLIYCLFFHSSQIKAKVICNPFNLLSPTLLKNTNQKNTTTSYIQSVFRYIARFNPLLLTMPHTQNNSMEILTDSMASTLPASMNHDSL